MQYLETIIESKQGTILTFLFVWPRHQKRQRPIYHNQKYIQKSAKYLGVTFDQRLTFKTHTKDRKALGLKTDALLKFYFRSPLPKEIKIRWYKSILRSMVIYGHELFSLRNKYRATRKVWKILDKIHRKIMECK